MSNGCAGKLTGVNPIINVYATRIVQVIALKNASHIHAISTFRLESRTMHFYQIMKRLILGISMILICFG